MKSVDDEDDDVYSSKWEESELKKSLFDDIMLTT